MLLITRLQIIKIMFASFLYNLGQAKNVKMTLEYFESIQEL